MPRIAESSERRWFPLGIASRMLEVNQATLRVWADRGLIRVYRTPGGHRRFARDDLQALLDSPTDAHHGRQERDFGELALRRIRRRLHGRTVGSERWYERFDEEGRSRMRLFGRRLLTLATDFLNRRGRRHELLEEARFLGEEYGAEMARRSLSLEDAMRAFAFFRNSLMDGIRETPGSGLSSSQAHHIWQQVNMITDEVLQGIARAYQRSTRSVPARRPG